jgi:hypothetical protein
MKTGPLALLTRPDSPLKNAVQPEFLTKPELFNGLLDWMKKMWVMTSLAGGGARAF